LIGKQIQHIDLSLVWLGNIPEVPKTFPSDFPQISRQKDLPPLTPIIPRFPILHLVKHRKLPQKRCPKKGLQRKPLCAILLPALVGAHVAGWSSW